MVQKATQLPEVQRLDAVLHARRERLHDVEDALSADRWERFERVPDLYLTARQEREMRYLKYRSLVSLASWGLAFGLTRVPAIQPFSTLIWIATFVGVIPRTVDHFVYKRMERQVDEDVTTALNQQKGALAEEIERIDRQRTQVFEGSLQRLMEQAAKDEAARRADPNGHVEVEEEAITVGGVRVPRKPRDE